MSSVLVGSAPSCFGLFLALPYTLLSNHFPFTLETLSAAPLLLLCKRRSPNGRPPPSTTFSLHHHQHSHSNAVEQQQHLSHSESEAMQWTTTMVDATNLIVPKQREKSYNHSSTTRITTAHSSTSRKSLHGVAARDTTSTRIQIVRD